jgi:pyruvate formate lyase activating enzyme
MIGGYKDLSLIDYPGLIAPVVFIRGCNFRCPFCQNTELVLPPFHTQTYSVESIIKRIVNAKSLADGVVVTGGEPTLWPKLEDFLRHIRKTGMKIKLDTNGSQPHVIKQLIEQGLVDYTAMDIKTSICRYKEATGIDVDTSAIRESITILKNSGIPYEFRTTCVPALVGETEIVSICQLLGPGENLVLQNFRPEQTLDPAFSLIKPYSPDEMENLLDAASAKGLAVKII